MEKCSSLLGFHFKQAFSILINSIHLSVTCHWINFQLVLKPLGEDVQIFLDYIVFMHFSRHNIFISLFVICCHMYYTRTIQNLMFIVNSYNSRKTCVLVKTMSLQGINVIKS